MDDGEKHRKRDKNVRAFVGERVIRIMYYQHDHDVLKEATVVGTVFNGDITSQCGGCNYEVKYIALLSYGIIKMTLVICLLLCVSDEGMELSLSGQIRGSNPNAFGFFSRKIPEHDCE